MGILIQHELIQQVAENSAGEQPPVPIQVDNLKEFNVEYNSPDIPYQSSVRASFRARAAVPVAGLLATAAEVV